MLTSCITKQNYYSLSKTRHCAINYCFVGYLVYWIFINYLLRQNQIFSFLFAFSAFRIKFRCVLLRLEGVGVKQK